MKAWEEYKRMWTDEVERLRNSEDELDKLVYKYLEEGLLMSRIPPVGVELSIAEYKELKEAGYNINEFHGWCWSGREMHERIRPANLGLQTPRKGFYFVRQIVADKSILICYYNYKNCSDFLDETVEISRVPFYNAVSIKPKVQNIGVGDIIEVKCAPELILHSENGKNLNAYRIEWNLIKHPQLSLEEREKIRKDIVQLKQDGYVWEHIISDANCDRAEVNACIKEKFDLPFTAEDIKKAQAELVKIKEQIEYYEGLIDNL